MTTIQIKSAEFATKHFSEKGDQVISDISFTAGYHEADQQSSSLKEENQRLREALEELVELKDMKDRLPRFNESQWDEFDALKKEYNTRKLLAWEAARKLVKP